MKLKRGEIRSLIRSIILERVQVDPEKGIPDIETAKQFESLATLKLLSEKEMYAEMHQLTKSIIAGNPELMKISNWVEGFQRPTSGDGQAALGNSLILAQGKYSFLNGTGSSVENNNYNLAFSSGEYVESEAQTFMQKCLASGGGDYPGTDGEKLEIGVAAVLAALNPGTTYSARQDNAQGQDIVAQGKDEYFELKYSKQSGGNITTEFSNSIPVVSAVHKYIIFLSSDRGYLIHCPVLARIYSFGLDSLPNDTTAAENARYNSSLIHYMVNQPALKEAILDGLRNLYNTTIGATPSAKPNENQYVDVFINAINNAGTQKNVFIDTLRKLWVVNKGPSRSSSSRASGDSVTAESSPTYTTDDAAAEAFNGRFLLNGSLRNSAQIRGITATVQGITLDVGSGFWETLKSLLQQLTIAWGFDQLPNIVIPTTPTVGTGASGAGAPGSIQRKRSQTPTGINWKNYLNSDDVENSAKAMFIFTFLNDPNKSTTIKETIKGWVEKSPDRRAFRNNLRNDYEAVEGMLKEIMGGSYGKQRVIGSYFKNILNRIMRRGIQVGKPEWRAYNNLLNKRWVTTYISEYMNQMGDKTGQPNEFWTSFERDCRYDADLYDMFLEANPLVSKIIQNDQDFINYRKALESAIDSIYDNPELVQKRAELVPGVKSKYFKDAIAQFEAMLTPDELKKFRIAYDDDKVDFIKQYFIDNPEKENPIRSGHYDIMNVAGQEQRDYDEEMYMSGFDESFKNRSLLDLIVENEEYYEEASNIENDIDFFEEDQKIQERRRIYELGESHASLLRKKYYGRR